VSVLTSIAVVSSEAAATSADMSSVVVDTGSAVSARVGRTLIYVYRQQETEHFCTARIITHNVYLYSDFMRGLKTSLDMFPV